MEQKKPSELYKNINKIVGASLVAFCASSSVFLLYETASEVVARVFPHADTTPLSSFERGIATETKAMTVVARTTDSGAPYYEGLLHHNGEVVHFKTESLQGADVGAETKAMHLVPQPGMPKLAIVRYGAQEYKIYGLPCNRGGVRLALFQIVAFPYNQSVERSGTIFHASFYPPKVNL